MVNVLRSKFNLQQLRKIGQQNKTCTTSYFTFCSLQGQAQPQPAMMLAPHLLQQAMGAAQPHLPPAPSQGQAGNLATGGQQQQQQQQQPGQRQSKRSCLSRDKSPTSKQDRLLVGGILYTRKDGRYINLMWTLSPL